MIPTPPPPEALATAPKAIVISQFAVLLGDIAEAKANAADVTFDYTDPKGNKEARSYIYAQRKLNARIESARVDAKAYALQYGKKVDSQAAELKQQVAALMKPHLDAIDAIDKAEADRVQRHRDVIQAITENGRVSFGASANSLALGLKYAKAIKIDGLEEFKEQAAVALLETIRTLEAAHAKALADEAAAAELEQLREQQRIQAEKDAEDARIKAQSEAVAEAASKAQKEAEQRAVGEDPEPPETVPAQLTRSGPVPPSAASIYSGRTRADATDTSTAGEVEGGYAARHRLKNALAVAMAVRDSNFVIDALVAGTLHPAVKIDWSLV